ncbi:hypothetical protein [uncultured Microbacterium sp.]|uniref:hypothetical protein n=1 Tax=uncultured Microbacterium sp. TaxID=191216 RepID=UPI0028D27F38|nr:hypothetical protein [uncultured Microbacterium sp.]
MTIRRKIAVGAMGLLMAAGMSIAIAPAAQAADYSVSIADYCARNVPSGTAAPSQATNINNRWDGWRCGARTGLVGVDVATACKQQHGSNAKAVVVNQTASGWRCRV